MKIHKPAFSVALILVASAGLAAEPSAPAASTKATTATAAPAPGAATVPQPSKPVKTNEASAAAALAQSAHELGYSKKLLDGKTVYYCKADAEVGTRITHTKCYTEDQMSAVVQRSIANRQSVADFEHKWMNQPGGDRPPPVNGGMTGGPPH